VGTNLRCNRCRH